MQALSLSSDHGSSLCKTKGGLCSQSQILPFKPDSSRRLNYNYTFTSSTSLSAKSTATQETNLIFPLSTLKWRRRSKTGHFLPPLLCGNTSNTLSANDGSGNISGRSFRGWVEVVGEVISTAFPIWVALGCFLGLVRPNSFNWVQPRWTMMGITLTMLGMGMTLTFDDLKGALAMPKELLAGFFLQYSVMPLTAFFVSKLLNLPSYYAAGLILVGCCPGGTASNIVTYIARGNVALSVLMTAASTVSAVVMTPFLTSNLAGQYVAVDAIGLLKSTLQVVLLPVLVGAFLNQYFKGFVKLVSPLMPPVAVATVAILCGNAIAQSSSAILMSGQQVVLAALLLHISGFFFGYLLSRILGIDVSSSRTISIEVGMQNSVLGVVLATQHFGNPLTAVPCAVSSVCHSILGSALAGIWRQI
ncbi:probable sodium/metabolite cotransporter BASS1, chloroplastic [Cynara cardunculus var. scolymus]|uniref:probable sodium/metabolite cotransporter BASS1, chloroplastic n=1 Tax=Cynara cardunculus var. scolymus TaxID=59895 RepID=UPI000D627AE3|nr:probable sodium/metabolite cotransporter BASS1, chloroplastic [Cynara cardunculus var. scolymus]